MFRWHKIVTERSCDEILFRLAGMVKDSSFSDYVIENYFSITVSKMKFRFNGKPFGLQFNGSVKTVDGKTEIKYRPMLPKSIVIVLCIPLISLVITMLKAGFSQDSIILFCVVILIFVLLYIFVTLALRDYINDFESRLM